VVRDITERKRAEFDAHRQSEILEKIVDHIPVMINFTGSDGRIKLVNQEWQTTLGWSLEDVVREGADVFTACYPDPAYRADVLKFVSTCSGEWADFKTRTRDGRVIDTCWARVLLSDGTTIGIGRDITEQKQAERAVRDAEQKYRELFENARDALYVHDLNGRYTSVNRAAESLTGYDREEILGKDFVGFVARKHVSRVRKNLCKKLEEESETTYEVEIITKDGRRIPVEVSSHLIYNNGIPVGVQGAVRDISDRKKAQESLQSFSRRLLAAQEAERQRIARTLHDEIGQVLTAVKINLQTTHGSLDSIDSADRITESIDIIDEALVRVRDLSIDLRPPHLDDFGLATALRWYVDTYSQRTGTKAKFSEELNGSSRRLPQEIETACFRIAQEALTNITRHAAASSVSLKLKQRREQLRLTITDNGIGFDVLAVTGRITAETLGLRGMKERTQAVGGSLEINSTLGKGTEVRALFPIQGARK
jgi:PAS domain S-box-containing protein